MDSNKLASMLLSLAYTLFAIFLVIIAIEAFPVRLINPDWILALSVNLVNAVTIPLVGLGLVHLAANFSSESRFKLIQQRFSRVATWVTFGFFLLLPLLGLLTFLNGQKIERSNLAQEIQIEQKATQIRQAVAAAQTPKELQLAMVALQGPQIGAADLSQPLPLIKQQIVSVVAQAKGSFLAQQKGPYSKEYIPVLKQILRTSVLSLISGFGFAALAWNPRTNKTLLTVWLDGFRSFALHRPGIKGDWAKRLTAWKAWMEANRAKRGRREQVKKRVSDVEHERARRKAEFKRKENELLKMRQREYKKRQKPSDRE